jgi:hypothetical protein
MDPQFRPLFTIRFETTPQVVGSVPAGYFRRAGIITRGSFEGDRIRGTVLPGGGDWLFTRPDGVTHLDVRTILQTDSDETIYMTYTGRLRQPADGGERLANGQTLTEEELYFRTCIQFETAAAGVLWLNDIVAIGVGHRRPDGPVYRVFELL